MRQVKWYIDDSQRVLSYGSLGQIKTNLGLSQWIRTDTSCFIDDNTSTVIWLKFKTDCFTLPNSCFFRFHL